MSTAEILRMSDDEVQAHLEEQLRVNVATVSPDGTAHLVPMRYVMIDGLVTVSTDPGSRKVRNLRRDSRVTGMVEGGIDFLEMRGVQLIGRAEIIDDRERSIRVLEALLDRYDGPMPPDALATTAASLVDVRIPIVIRPERVISWDHRKMADLQYRQAGAVQ